MLVHHLLYQRLIDKFMVNLLFSKHYEQVDGYVNLFENVVKFRDCEINS